MPVAVPGIVRVGPGFGVCFPPSTGGGGGTTPILLANGTFGSGTSNTFSSLASVSAPAGSVVQMALLTQGAPVSSVTDSVDPGTPWTQVAAGGPSSMDLRLFQRIVPAGGFNSSTTYTVTWGSAGSSSAMVVASFPGATTAPSANAGSQDVTSSSISLAVTGPTSGTSWQFAGIGSSVNAGSAGPQAGSTGGWVAFTGGSNVNANGWGLVTYYRQASNTSATTLNEDAGGFSLMSGVWGEAKP